MSTPANSTTLYRYIWRWHFYAGLFCLPFVFLLAVSGSIYLFKPQIDSWVEKPYQNLRVESSRSTPDQQVATALAAVPGSSFIHYQLPPSERDAVVVSVNDKGKHMLVYVNPYTLDVLKTIGYDDQFIRLVRSFHGELMVGNIGSVLVELAGCWAIMLIISGLYLWWPRNARGLGGILYPRWSRTGRLWWRDFHAVIGFWIALLVLFLLISGLPWSLVWGNGFNALRTLQTPASHAQHEVMWSISRAEENAQLVQQAQTQAPLPQLSTELLNSAQAQNLAPPVFMAPDRHDPRLWRLSSDHQNRTLRSTVWLDRDGALVRQQTFADEAMLDRVVAVGVSAHEGQLFGWFNQLLGLLTTTGLMAISVSGFIMWRKRKPTTALGAPQVPPNTSAGKVVGVVMLVLAALLPLVAISLVLLIVLEKLVLRHFTPLQQWLGLNPN